MKEKNFFQKLWARINAYLDLPQATSDTTYRVFYRLLSIEQNKKQEYQATVQVIGKNRSFTMKPEEILADDKLTNFFSPTDVRTLTYLGYLGINSPKYKILAQKLSEQNDGILFVLHKKGTETVEVKKAKEILSDKKIISGLDQDDASMVGYTAANEASTEKEKKKVQILKRLESKKQNTPKIKSSN